MFLGNCQVAVRLLYLEGGVGFAATRFEAFLKGYKRHGKKRVWEAVQSCMEVVRELDTERGRLDEDRLRDVAAYTRRRVEAAL